MPISFAISVFALSAALAVYPNSTGVIYQNTSLSEQSDQKLDTSVIEVQDDTNQITMDPDGLYYVKGAANNQQVRFIVDSGANTTIITKADARRLGIDPRTLRYREKLVTANGSAPLAFVQLPSLTIAGKSYTNVQVAVFGRDGGVSLLGQDMLRRFRRFAIEDGVMTLA